MARPAHVAMVEECFPAAALTDKRSIPTRRERRAAAENQRLPMGSCTRFIDFDRIDCFPTSQFDIRRFTP